ncbi:MAG: winged helix-turn-helix domain-containing protein [Candidatus Acidiferrales bacterium]
MAIPAESEQTVRFGKFELDLRTRELRNNGRRLTLQEKPFQILAALLERPGQLVTRDELTRRLWPSDTFVDFEHSLNKAVNRLREALEDSAEHPRLIETLPRLGYRFIAPLEAVESPKLENPSEESATVSELEVKPARLRHAWSALGIILSLAFLLAAWLWIGHRDAKPSEPEFQRLSFGRGMIRSARFAPDGQTVVYGAAWDGKPAQLFWTKAGSFESRPLGVEGDILAISPSGEMAVLQNQRFGANASQGTLALMSLTGGAPRKLLDHVQDADWSPDGSKLVVTHYVGSGRCDLEFPPGKVLYETTGGAWMSHPRVSPRGDRIAVMEHPWGEDDAGFLEILDLTGNKKILSLEFTSIEGLAWDPAGDAIWFSGSELGPFAPRAVFKLTIRGQQHLVRREAGNITLRDVSRDGHLALTRDTYRGEVFGRIDSENKEREYGWLDNSFAADLSRDGSTVLLSVQGEASASGYAVYVRKTDGSPAVRLGDGFPLQFSPDGKWVMTTGVPSARPPQLSLLPTGIGEPVTLTHDSISHYLATLLPDGKRFLFEGNEPGRARRNWVQSVAGGKPVPITPEGTVGHLVSLEGKLLVAVDSERRFWLYPLSGGQPRPLSGIEPEEDTIRWSVDGRFLFVVGDGIPASIYRVEILTGRRQLVYKLAPGDAAGLWNIWPVLITPDGKSYVYSDYRILSDLYLANGLR